MLAVAMTFATLWGVLQLALLGSVSRSVRGVTLLLAVGVGAYGCGIAAAAVETGINRAMGVGGLTGFGAVQLAGYTVDPFVEEVAKVLPLVAAAVWIRTRRQWGFTDFTLVGAAIGAGFGLLEALLRFSHRTGNAVATADGWLLPISLAPPFVPGAGATVTSWLPAPARGELLSFGGQAATSQHLVWTAVAGLGIGVLARVRGPLRLLGVLPVLVVGADHASFNYGVSLAGNPVGDVLAAPFELVRPLLWFWPLLALGAAAWLDLRFARAARARHPEALLRGEVPSLAGAWAAIGRYASLRPPWTGVVAWRFELARRAALNAADDASGPRPGPPDPLLAEVVSVRGRMDAVRDPGAWEGVGLRRALSIDGRAGRSAPTLRRYWPILVWLLLLAPAALYFIVGTTPLLAGVQGLLASPWLFPLVVVALTTGLVWTLWSVVVTTRALPALARGSAADPAAQAGSRVLIGAGVFGLGVVSLVAWAAGAAGGDRPFPAHVLDALSDVLLVGGIALVLAGLFFFPPFAAVAVAGGGIVLIPTLTAQLAAMGALGVTSILLSQAAEGAGSGGGGSTSSGSGGGGTRVPDIPQVAPRPKPPVRHWKLRNIVDNLWHRPTSSTRVGDGTTMDALRNETLTGRPTQGVFHKTKAEEAVTALRDWLTKYEKTASGPDVTWARTLKAELQSLLRQAP